MITEKDMEFIREYLATTGEDHYKGEELEDYQDEMLNGPAAKVLREFKKAFGLTSEIEVLVAVEELSGKLG